MLESIRRFVQRRMLADRPAAPDRAASPAPTPPDARSSGPAHAVQLAAAALLLELAHADGEFSDAERLHVESAVARHFGLDPEETEELLALAEAERRESIDRFQFTRLIAEHYDLGQKMVLAEVMWGVILADGRIADHEASLVRRIASLLELEPAYLAQARKAAAERR